ncbi:MULTISPECIES: DHA2 family efflux MFS transporter permease subunit [Rhodopseudomonas]|uniref:DSBA oxidoreductase n=1 Tax=Rhodopseudomonas palustris TaxID=1076 RepID=A0A0D7EJN8_RHOPL|nr:MULTISPECIES: DHA2 family efflux MFS transporter permease subunit [Rhodopseudomonas]KIZ41064.1 DSBA oxidoreductase [Rhodopseudomonas palustris]MDF3813009.1 DHA2 family efflux MFS transporter permease subunit [Rhodopseudomonas sp. BAL398]WOK17558.1 DHA2 family efflux MFS transporter permease subunit [Rhodopseudomonas sp. BAL398]
MASEQGEYGTNPWLIAVLVSVATFMEVLDTTIANVALRYISGGLAVSSDEASWVVTTYLVANSIVLCASGWIAEMFGRKNFFLACITLFTVSSLLCGMAWDLQSLLVFRILQGLAGGGMTPVAQSILAAAFPPAKRGQGFALYGIAVVVAPVVGPTLGGWLSDNLSWHWCFLINVPVGVMSLILIYLIIPASEQQKKARAELWAKGPNFDFIGFILVAVFLGALEVVLDRGQIDGWFDSSFIVTFSALSLTGLVLFVPWELHRDKPLIDIRMLAGRQFGTCFAIMLATGALLIATTQILPQLLQERYGYTATLAGLVISPGGLVTMVMMVVVGRLSAIQPRWLIAAGACICVGAMADLLRLSPNADYWYFAMSRIYLGLGLPLIFIPITTASYDGIPANKTDQASAMINLARNFGGSIGVSISQTVLAQREQFHHSRLAEHIGAWNPFFHDTLNGIQNYLKSQNATGDNAGAAMAVIGRIVENQSALLAYIDVFVALACIALLMVPLALSLRTVDRSAKPAMGH